MLAHNNVFTHMWLEHFVGKILKENEKWKNLQTNMLWIYGLSCCVTLTNCTKYNIWCCDYLYMYITIKNVVDAFLMYFEIFCRYETLWDGPMAMVASSFGGLVLKSFMVEMHKHVYQKQMNNLDVKTQNCCEKFLKNLKGVVFYNVPHINGTQDLSKFFKWQCQ